MSEEAQKQPETNENGPEKIATLEDLSHFLSDLVGPNTDAIERFLGKESDKFELIQLRLNELIVMLEEIVTAQQFGDPNELAQHLKTVFQSIDAICRYVYDVKGRLMKLEKEIDRHKPNKLIGFFKKNKDQAQAPIDTSSIVFETDKLLEQHGIVLSE